MAIDKGSIVWLKSGGPKMTVKQYLNVAKTWECHWFETHTLMRGEFTLEELTETDPKSK